MLTNGCLSMSYREEERKKAILQNVSDKIEEAVRVDGGYIEFEAIGKEDYLGEKSHTRGANSTSIDAIMMGAEKNT